MNSTDMKNFLKALDAVQKDYTCGVCNDLCKNPVTLSKCFHIICSEHFEGLKSCPECEVSLEDCCTYLDDRLESCIESVKTLNEMFEKYKECDETKVTSNTNTSSGSRKRTQTKANVSKESDNVNKVDKADKKVAKTRKRTRQMKNPTINYNDENSKKDNEKENMVSTNQKGISQNEDALNKNKALTAKSKPSTKTKNENVNISMNSTSSSKFNKAIEKRNSKGETLLHIACRLGKIDRVMELLEQGANTNTKDNAGWTPLHEVVQNGRLDLVRLLLQYNTLINVPGQSNETPLHEAVRYNHKEIAEELVKNGADINMRNCKGETPLQLAAKEMRKVLETAADNIIQTQTVNITHISELHSELDFDDIKVFCTSESKSVNNKLKALVKHHNNIHIEVKWSKKVTHLIVDAKDGICQSSLDVLHGIVNSVWILSAEWVLQSSEEKLQPFPNYEVVGVGSRSYNGPKNSRYNKYKQHPGLFNGCHFYFHNFTTKFEISKHMVLTKAILTKLVTDAGGIILRRAPNPELIPDAEKLVPYHAKKDGKLVNCSHFIIFKDMYEPMYNMQHLKALPIGWLIECIEKYELCEPWSIIT